MTLVTPKAATAIKHTTALASVLFYQEDLLDLFDVKGRGNKGSDIYEGPLSAMVLTQLDSHPEDGPALFEVLRPLAVVYGGRDE